MSEHDYAEGQTTYALVPADWPDTVRLDGERHHPCHLDCPPLGRTCIADGELWPCETARRAWEKAGRPFASEAGASDCSPDELQAAYAAAAERSRLAAGIALLGPVERGSILCVPQETLEAEGAMELLKEKLGTDFLVLGYDERSGIPVAVFGRQDLKALLRELELPANAATLPDGSVKYCGVLVDAGGENETPCVLDPGHDGGCSFEVSAES